MKRMHIHLRVADLAHNINFYSALFDAEPAVVKDDYAKWMLDDPRINFAISTRADETGLDHLGFQVDTEDELHEMQSRLSRADLPIETQKNAACCYAKSNKHWTVDPQGIAWESYHTLDSIPTYNDTQAKPAENAAACCAPVAAPLALSIKPKTAASCGAPSSSEAKCC